MRGSPLAGSESERPVVEVRARRDVDVPQQVRGLGDVVRPDPQDAHVDVAGIDLPQVVLLEARGQRPDVAVVPLDPPDVGGELDLLGTVRQDPVQTWSVNEPIIARSS